MKIESSAFVKNNPPLNKNLFAILFILFVTAVSLSAMDLKNYLLAGVAVPVDIGIKVKEDDSTKKWDQIGLDLDLSYIGIDKYSGLAGKVRGLLGGARTKNLLYKNDSIKDSYATLGGFYCGVEFGAGYSFIHNDEDFLSIFAMAGVVGGLYQDLYSFGSSMVKYKITRNISYALLSTGIDFTAQHRFSKNVGIFADLGFRYFPTGGYIFKVETKRISGSSSSSRTQKSDYKINGGFEILPAIGFSFSL